MNNFYDEDIFNDDNIMDKEINKTKSKVIKGILFGVVITFILLFSSCSYGIYNAYNLLNDSHVVQVLKGSTSPDGRYKIKAFRTSGGATVDFGVYCDLSIDGKTYEKIYTDYHVKDANIEWIDNDTVSINSHIIDLPDGRYDWTENNDK